MNSISEGCLIMEKIQVEICMGTTCFIMGGESLQELASILQRKYPDKVDTKGIVCHGLCNTDCQYSKAPYVKVDGEAISEATVEKVLAVIERKLNKDGH